MGKRKKSSRAPSGPKKREPLATTFTCLFCNHEKAIQVKLDKKAGVGNLYCKICGQKFQTGINYLSAAVDVYSDWVDACENVAQEAAAQEEEDRRFSSYATSQPRGGAAAATAHTTPAVAAGGGGGGSGGGGGGGYGGAGAGAGDLDDDDDDDY